MAIQMNFRVGSLGHLFLIAGETVSPMGLAQTIKEEGVFASVPTYLLATLLAGQLQVAGLIHSNDVHKPFKPTRVVQVGFSEDEFLKLFGELPLLSAAALESPAKPENRL